MIKIVVQVAGVVLGIICLALVAPEIYQYFGKRYADADREIHQKSKSYVFGAAEHIQRLKLDYDKSDNRKHRESIKQMVLLEAANININQFPPHLQVWITQLRSE